MANTNEWREEDPDRLEQETRSDRDQWHEPFRKPVRGLTRRQREVRARLADIFAVGGKDGE